jgi:hypothetical protein
MPEITAVGLEDAKTLGYYSGLVRYKAHGRCNMHNTHNNKRAAWNKPWFASQIACLFSFAHTGQLVNWMLQPEQRSQSFSNPLINIC